MTEPETVKHSPRTTRNTLLALAASTLLVIAALAVARAFGFEQTLIELLTRIEQTGALGALVLAVVLILSVPALLPTAPLTLGAGVLYGAVPGAALVVSSVCCGSLISMLLARGLLRGPVGRALQHRPRLAALLALPRTNDWQLVAMLRVIPFFPFKISNYALGLTPLSTAAYAFGTFIGLWPIALFNAWLGSLAGDVLSLSDAGRPHTPLGWALQIAGLIFCAALTLLLVRRATRALDAALAAEVVVQNKGSSDSVLR